MFSTTQTNNVDLALTLCLHRSLALGTSVSTKTFSLPSYHFSPQ